MPLHLEIKAKYSREAFTFKHIKTKLAALVTLSWVLLVITKFRNFVIPSI